MRPHHSPPPIGLHNLTLGYERHPAVHHVTLRVAPGSLVAVVGPNGAGKSTLLKGLAGLLPALQGHVHGLDRVRVAYLPQQSSIDRSFPINVADMVAMGLWHEVGALGRYTPAHRQRCAQALSQVGLTGFEQRPLDTLSGGQLQRALFARLILQDAPVMLLDEPFAAIDTRTCDHLLALMQGWHREGRTVLVVLHDMAQARTHFPQSILLARELVASGATAEVLTPEHLHRARLMQEAFDAAAAPCDMPEDGEHPVSGHGHAHAHGHDHGHTHTERTP